MKFIENVKKKTAKAAVKAGTMAAVNSTSSACLWYIYQPKMPKALKSKKD